MPGGALRVAGGAAFRAKAAHLEAMRRELEVVPSREPGGELRHL